jgi:GNAT superfamily N-acetyltransferase
VDTSEILELFDEQMRRKPADAEGFLSGENWSAVLWPPADGNVEPLIARMREQPGWAEWKYYSHDGPELREKLLAAGLEPEDEETVVVAEAASIPPPPQDLELREDVDAFQALALEVFGREQGSGWFPENAVPVVAYVDGKPVSSGRVDLDPGVEFAGLFGGVTLPEYRGRGLYRATIARRAEIAREAGYRFLFVDALPTSRPILERNGFVKLTTTTPFVIPRAAR